MHTHTHTCTPMIYEERCGRETGIELRETAIIKDGETCLIDLIARTAEGKKVRSNDLSDGRSGFVPAYAWCCLQIESFRFVRNELGTCYSSRSIVIEMMDKRKTKTKMSASICFRVAICRAFCRDCFRRFAHTYFYIFRILLLLLLLFLRFYQSSLSISLSFCPYRFQILRINTIRRF